jgi:hypothetical protein
MFKRSFVNYKKRLGSMTLGEIFSLSGSVKSESSTDCERSEYYSDVYYTDAYIYGDYVKDKSDVASTTSKSSSDSSSSKLSSASSTSLNSSSQETGEECEYNYDGSISSDLKNAPVAVPVMKAQPICPPAVPEKTYLTNKKLNGKMAAKIRQQEDSECSSSEEHEIVRSTYNTNENVIFQARQFKSAKKQHDRFLL